MTDCTGHVVLDRFQSHRHLGQHRLLFCVDTLYQQQLYRQSVFRLFSHDAKQWPILVYNVYHSSHLALPRSGHSLLQLDRAPDTERPLPHEATFPPKEGPYANIRSIHSPQEQCLPKSPFYSFRLCFCSPGRLWSTHH